jgi:hypothetical protein
MKYLAVMADHRADPDYEVFSDRDLAIEKCRVFARQYLRDDETLYEGEQPNCYEYYWSSLEDYVYVTEVKVDGE